MRAKHSGFGGFPMPHEIISAMFRRFFPKLERQFTKTLTIPRTHTIASVREGAFRPRGAKLVSYISFDAVIGGNSRFEGLTKEELEELGGLEYKGLTALLWIVGGVSNFRPVIVQKVDQYSDSITFYFSLLHSQLLLLTCQCHDGKMISKYLLYTKTYLLFGELSLWSR